MKILFYNLQKLITHENVQIKQEEIKQDKEIFNFKELDYEKKCIMTGQYTHIIKNNNKLQLYYQIHLDQNISNKDKLGIGYAEYINNNFKKINVNKFQEKNIILKEGLACNNFKVFIDTNPNININEKYKAIGGYHVGNNYHKNCICNNNYETKYCYNPVWPNEKKKYLIDNIDHPCRGNGLYVYKSKDGINWLLLYNKPVLSLFTKCKDLPEGIFNFDTMPSIFYDKNIKKYVLYIRANIKLGVRHILYTSSIDLLNWEEPELINLNPNFNFENDNLYYSCVIPYDNYYLAFPSFFKNKILNKSGSNRKYWDEKTLVMISENGKDWDIINDYFTNNISNNPNWIGHMKNNHILSFINNIFYVQHDFYTNHNKLFTYNIRQDGFTSLSPIDNKIGILELDISKFNNYFLINYKCNNNGYIKIIELDIKLENDSINTEIKNKNLKKITIELYNSELYSLYN